MNISWVFFTTNSTVLCKHSSIFFSSSDTRFFVCITFSTSWLNIFSLFLYSMLHSIFRICDFVLYLIIFSEPIIHWNNFIKVNRLQASRIWISIVFSLVFSNNTMLCFFSFSWQLTDNFLLLQLKRKFLIPLLNL